MAFLATLAAVFAACLALRNPLKKMPWLFYALALLADVAMLANSAGLLPQFMRLPMAFLMRKGMLGVALFVVVMYIGVLPRSGRLSRWLRPVRAELSIVACLLVAGHMCTYVAVLLPQVLHGTPMAANVFAAFWMGLLLLALVVVLGVTSARFVKRHMHAHAWKRLQNLAYVFYVLILVHVLAMLGPAAASGNPPAVASVAVYGVVFGAYIVLRLWRASVDRRDKVDLADTVRDQGFQQ